jgi:hypothetical protein
MTGAASASRANAAWKASVMARIRSTGGAVQERPVDELADEAAVQDDAPWHCEQLTVAAGQVDAVRGPAGVGDRVAELLAECLGEGGLAGAVAAVKDDDGIGGECRRQPAGHGRFTAVASSAGQEYRAATAYWIIRFRQLGLPNAHDDPGDTSGPATSR